MQLTFTTTEQDSVNAQKAHAWRRYSQGQAKFQAVVSPILGVLFILYGIHGYRSGSIHSTFVIWLEIICGFYLMLATSVIAPLQYRRAYRRRNYGFAHENVISITEECVVCDCKDRSYVKLEWSTIKGYLDSPTTILLYTSPTIFLSLPKRAMSVEQVGDILNILHKKDVYQGYPTKASLSQKDTPSK